MKSCLICSCVQKNVVKDLQGLHTNSFICGFCKVTPFGQEGVPYSFQNGGSVKFLLVSLLRLVNDFSEVSSTSVEVVWVQHIFGYKSGHKCLMVFHVWRRDDAIFVCWE